MKMILRTICFIPAMWAMLAVSQETPSRGRITIIKDERINQLHEQYINVAKNNNSLDGFRIQVFFDSGALSRRNATATRERFIQKYPHIETYIDFKEPFYRVRVGDFRTRLEAEGFRRSILNDYPNAFTVNDKINPPPIQ